MRIGFDAKRFFHNKTGLGNYSRSLVKVLSDYFPEHHYYLYNPKHSNKYSLEGYNKNVSESNPVGKLQKKFKSLWRLFSITNLAKKDNLDIYHGLSGEIPFGIQNANCKTVVTIHDLIFVRYPELYSFFDRKIHFWKFKYAAQKSDLVVAISEQTKQDIISFLGINASKIKVIYQGCHAIFKQNFSSEEKITVREKFSLPEKFILNVGTIEKRKNLLTIVKAIKNTDFPLVVIGKKTDYYKEVEAFINENQMQNRVFFLKDVSQEELAMLYQLATLFVYPSIFEGFGIPIIEALYSKTPVISSTGSCFTEAGGPDSLYVNPEDASELEQAILTVWNSEKKQQQMIERGWQYAQQFNDEAIANNWMETYTTLIAKS